MITQIKDMALGAGNRKIGTGLSFAVLSATLVALLALTSGCSGLASSKQPGSPPGSPPGPPPGPTRSMTASWAASTSPVVGYNVYRASTSGGPYAKLNASPVTNLSYTDATAVSGQTYYYVTTAVDSNGTESFNSNEAKAVAP